MYVFSGMQKADVRIIPVFDYGYRDKWAHFADKALQIETIAASRRRRIFS